MSLTYSSDFKGQANGVNATITSNALSVNTGDYLNIVGIYADNAESTAWTVTNTGTAITWTKQQETNTGGNTKVVHWTGTAGATPPTTVSVQSTAGTNPAGSKAILSLVHRGQHATTPLPAGNLFSIVAGTDVTQAITPTSAGSNLWMVLGDWAAIDPASGGMAAGANCSLEVADYFESGAMTAAVIRPTTQPRTDTTLFTLAESETGGIVSGIAFEVQAAGGSVSTPMFRGH